MTEDRKFKTTTIPLLSGKRVRIKYVDYAFSHEQQNIMGGVDVILYLVSGYHYIVQLSRKQIDEKFNRT